MKTDIIPKKIIINFKEDKTFDKAILLYKTLDDSGQESEKFYTISIKSQASIPQLNGFIDKAYNFVKQQEKIQEK